MKLSDRQTVFHLSLCAIIAAVYLVNLGTSSIWDSNEAFYVETPREMMRSGQYLIPTFNDQFRLNKPPLSYWIVVMAYQLFGVSVHVQRLIGVVFLVGVLVAVWRLCRTLELDEKWSWLAVALTALTPRIVIMGRRALLEVMVLFFVVAALHFFFHYYRKGGRASIWFFYLGLGLGFLAKGPVAVVLPSGIILLFLAFQRRMSFLRNTQLFPGAGIFLAIVLPWYIGLYSAMGAKWIVRFFFEENFQRFTTGDYGPQRGLLYYPGAFLGDFFPWSILTLAAGWMLVRGWKQLSTPAREAVSFLATWLVLPILFFSLSKNKQEYYIMPVYPAGAILLSMAWSYFSADKRWVAFRRWIGGITWGMLGAAGLAIAALVYGVLGLPMAALVLGVLIVGLQPFGWRWLARGMGREVIGLHAVGLGLMFVILAISVVPRLEDFRPIPRFAEILQSRSSPEDRIGSFDYACPSLCFYTRRSILELTTAEELIQVFRQPQTMYCVMREHQADILHRQGIPHHVVAAAPLLRIRLKDLLASGGQPHGERLLLVTNKTP